MTVIIVMTRLPRDGRNKTRLIPALGSSGATAFHDRLARHAVGRASAYVLMHPGSRVEVQLEGGTPADGRTWLGEIECLAQQQGDLGKRMRSAVERAFTDGAKRVVVMGSDCPAIDEDRLGAAFDALDTADLVFGPAADGGYYLVGLSRPCAAIFNDIDWGGPMVLDQSLTAAKDAGFHPALLGVLSDVDVPDDLPAANAVLAEAISLSVIIATLNEAAHLPYLLDRLKQGNPHEIIVADGGSSDRTVEIARQAGVRVCAGTRGRAAQMNFAAESATGEFLLFLHADTLPPTDYQNVITRVLQSPATSAGAFRFKLTGDLPSAPLIESLVHLRCRLLDTPYGDQGLFLRRRVFQHVDGFPDWPVMEDLHLVRRLKRLGRVRTAPEAACTSVRRWQKGGTIRTFLRHQLMLTAYHLGAPPSWIARFRN